METLPLEKALIWSKSWPPRNTSNLGTTAIVIAIGWYREPQTVEQTEYVGAKLNGRPRVFNVSLFMYEDKF